jgi:hypothetical protein
MRKRKNKREICKKMIQNYNLKEDVFKKICKLNIKLHQIKIQNPNNHMKMKNFCMNLNLKIMNKPRIMI